MKGIVQEVVDSSAPIIHIAIVFLQGADRPSVNYEELRGETRMAPSQKTPEWRVATAATLLKRFEIKDDFSISRPDDSNHILEAKKLRELKGKSLPPASHTEQGENSTLR